MQKSEIATRYANALFFFARDRNALDSTYEQLGPLQELFERDRGLINFLTAPQVSDDKKESLIRRIFEGRYERLLVEFFLLVARKRRVGHLPDIIAEFRDLVSEQKGLVKVTVTTAFPLSADQRQALSERIEKKTGKKARIVERRDNRAIGGMKIQIKDQAVDGTVRTALNAMRHHLESVDIFAVAKP